MEEMAIRCFAQTYNYVIFEDIRKLDCHANYSINEPQIASRPLRNVTTSRIRVIIASPNELIAHSSVTDFVVIHSFSLLGE